MPTTTPPRVPDDIDPADFLRRVREMTQEKDREDRLRAAALEKDIMERRARRAGTFPSRLVSSHHLHIALCLPPPFLLSHITWNTPIHLLIFFFFSYPQFPTAQVRA